MPLPKPYVGCFYKKKNVVEILQEIKQSLLNVTIKKKNISVISTSYSAEAYAFAYQAILKELLKYIQTIKK